MQRDSNQGEIYWVALDKSEGSAKGKVLLGGALESALEIELHGKYHNYIEHREKTSFPRGTH